MGVPPAASAPLWSAPLLPWASTAHLEFKRLTQGHSMQTQRELPARAAGQPGPVGAGANGGFQGHQRPTLPTAFGSDRGPVHRGQEPGPRTLLPTPGQTVDLDATPLLKERSGHQSPTGGKGHWAVGTGWGPCRWVGRAMSHAWSVHQPWGPGREHRAGPELGKVRVSPAWALGLALRSRLQPQVSRTRLSASASTWEMGPAGH